MTTLIALILMITITTTSIFVALPAAKAHDPPWDIHSWAYVDVSPKTTGVGQAVLIVMWIDKLPPTADGAYGDRYDDFTVDITAPDGSTDTLGPFTSDPVGSYATSYTPNQVGTYEFVFKFPGDKLTGEPFNPTGIQRSPVFINDTVTASTSEPAYLTVQEEPIIDWVETPLPTEYWRRPINGINRNWYQIAGNWLGQGDPVNSFAQYSMGPESAHIMWTRGLTFGGIGEGIYGDMSYYGGKSYETRIPNPVIMNGFYYYNEYADNRYPMDGNPPALGFYAVDLRTGETMWWKNDTVTFGQILNDNTPNEHGERAYLWKISGSVWSMYDPYTGYNLIQLTHVPSGTIARDEIGSMLKYQLNTGQDTLTLWNSTNAVLYPSVQAGSNYYWDYRTPQGVTIDARDGGFQWTVPIPSDITGGINIVLNDRIIGSSGLGYRWGTDPTFTVWALSLKPGQEGTMLWTRTVTADAYNTTWNLGSASLDDGVYIMTDKEDRTFYGYSLDTGEKLWGPTTPGNAWDMYSQSNTIAYGKLFTYGYGGVLRAFDIKTGDLLWNYTAESIGHEIAYPNYPLSLGAIADGKIYLYSTEHSPNKPLWRGSMIRCINTTDGTEIWAIEHWGNHPALADGYLVDLNLYDNQIYCYGKGPSAMTVTASPKVSNYGDAVLVEGMVIDTAAGTNQDEQASRFPNGVPAVSDDSMTAWMEYVYMQMPKPTDATGVDVTINVLDPNGNFYNVGTTTSDSDGFYKTTFKPEVPGEYTIIASFAGSNSYWPSDAKTAINVDSESTTPTPIQEPVQSVADTYLVPGIIAIILAIAIGFAVTILVLRKRP